jgi:hypothetical protein
MNEDRFFHGGVPGMHPGDLLVPSPPHVFDGCPICRARAAGRVFTVGDYRAWLTEPEWRRADPAVIAEIREVLDGVPDEAPIDAPSAEQAVYLTSSELYATWYAARSGGDLYRVKPLGRLTPSHEDHFDSFTVPRARVLQVVRRAVVLTDHERAALAEAWRAADERTTS